MQNLQIGLLTAADTFACLYVHGSGRHGPKVPISIRTCCDALTSHVFNLCSQGGTDGSACCMQTCAPAMRTMIHPHSSLQSVPAKAIPAACLPAAQSERVGQANTVYPDTKMIIFVGAPTIVSLAAQSAMVPIFMTTADTLTMMHQRRGHQAPGRLIEPLMWKTRHLPPQDPVQHLFQDLGH